MFHILDTDFIALCWYEKFEVNLNFCLFVLELNMKFLERPWYFKGEALAKHLMGK